MLLFESAAGDTQEAPNHNSVGSELPRHTTGQSMQTCRAIAGFPHSLSVPNIRSGVVRDAVSAYIRNIRRSECVASTPHELPFPGARISRETLLGYDRTYHLKSVELLLDLLCEHRCQAVASCNLSTSIIL